MKRNRVTVSSKEDDADSSEDNAGSPIKKERMKGGDGLRPLTLNGEPNYTVMTMLASDDEEDAARNVVNLIKVKGFNPRTQTDKIEKFFNSRKHSGGGEVIKITHIDGEAVITFSKPEAVQRVISRKTLILEGAYLSVRAMTDLLTDDESEEEFYYAAKEPEDKSLADIPPDLNNRTSKDALEVGSETNRPSEGVALGLNGTTKAAGTGKGLNDRTSEDTLEFDLESKKGTNGTEKGIVTNEDSQEALEGKKGPIEIDSVAVDETSNKNENTETTKKAEEEIPEVSQQTNEVPLPTVVEANKLDMHISDNTVIQHTITMEVSKARFIKKAYFAEIEQIEAEQPQTVVEIQFNLEEEDCHVLISGSENGIEQAKEKFDDLMSTVLTCDCEIIKPGICKYLSSSRGHDFIATLEKRYDVTLQMIKEEAKQNSLSDEKSIATTSDSGRDRTFSKAKLKNGTEILVCKGDLTTYRVGAIVNAANVDLKHIGGIALAIHRRGGPSIQEDSSAHIRRFGRLWPGQVYTSDAGTLPCGKIIHAVGPNWKGGNCGEENILYNAIYECMSEVCAHGLQSVGIPALGAGVFGVPITISATTIMNAVKDFCEMELEASGIRQVYLVDTNEMAVAQFHESLKASMGEDVVEVGTGSSVNEATQNSQTAATPSGPRSKLFSSVDDTTVESSSGVRIKLVKGGIEKQQVDVILNTTSESMYGKLGVSGAIFKAGGPKLKAEAEQHIPLKVGIIAVTDGHNLPCRSVYHVHCTEWDGPDQSCESIIKQIISETLKKASENHCQSVAFPAIGTGNNGVPIGICAEILYNEVATSPHTSVKDIRFVIHNNDTECWKAFVAEMDRQAMPANTRSSRQGEIKGCSSSSEEDMEVDLEIDSETTDLLEGHTQQPDDSKAIHTGHSEDLPLTDVVTKVRVWGRSDREMQRVIEEINDVCSERSKEIVSDSTADQEKSQN